MSVSSGIREEKKTTRASNVQQLNEIALSIQGQQTVQDIVSKATDLFRCLEDAKIVVDEKSKVEIRNNNKKIQEALSGIKELFSRLRAIYDETNRRVDIPQGDNLEVCNYHVQFQFDFKFTNYIANTRTSFLRALNKNLWKRDIVCPSYFWRSRFVCICLANDQRQMWSWSKSTVLA